MSILSDGEIELLEIKYLKKEFIFKVCVWVVLALIFVKDFNILYNYKIVLLFLFLTWISSIIYPRTVIRFGLLERENASQIYSTLFILFFSSENLIILFSNHQFKTSELLVSGLYLIFCTLIAILIYPKGTIFYPLLKEDSSNPLQPLERRIKMIIPLGVVSSIFIAFLLLFSSVNISKEFFNFAKDITLLIKGSFNFLTFVLSSIFYFFINLLITKIGGTYNLLIDKIIFLVLNIIYFLLNVSTFYDNWLFLLQFIKDLSLKFRLTLKL